MLASMDCRLRANDFGMTSKLNERMQLGFGLEGFKVTCWIKEYCASTLFCMRGQKAFHDIQYVCLNAN